MRSELRLASADDPAQPASARAYDLPPGIALASAPAAIALGTDEARRNAILSPVLAQLLSTLDPIPDRGDDPVFSRDAERRRWLDELTRAA